VDFNGDTKYSNVVSLRYTPLVVNILPNLNKGIFIIKSNSQGTYQIFKASGQIIRQGEIKNDLSTIYKDNEVVTKRIIKL